MDPTTKRPDAAVADYRPAKEFFGTEPVYGHPGEKLAEKGGEALTDAELLAILISTGNQGRTAVKIAEEIIAKYGSIEGMLGKPLESFYDFKGLGDVKIIRLAAAFEIGRRLWGKRSPASPTT